jgi:translation initiation factor IF-2
MTDTTEKDRKADTRPAGGTLTLKRPAIEQSKVKQSFGAGRSKTVVVETKRKRFDDKPVPANNARFSSHRPQRRLIHHRRPSLSRPRRRKRFAHPEPEAPQVRCARRILRRSGRHRP